MLALWARSYFSRDELAYRMHDQPRLTYRTLSLVSSRGGIQFEDYHFTQPSRVFVFETESDEHGWHRRSDPPCWLPDETPGTHFDFLGYPERWPDFGFDLRQPSLQTFHSSSRDSMIINYWDGVVIPYWMISLALAILPGIGFFNGVRQRKRRRFRLAHGACVECGYDLRASTGRCPECGTDRLTS